MSIYADNLGPVQEPTNAMLCVGNLGVKKHYEFNEVYRTAHLGTFLLPLSKAKLKIK
jgi:hypothetical protein